jgi:hypothetical protein
VGKIPQKVGKIPHPTSRKAVATIPKLRPTLLLPRSTTKAMLLRWISRMEQEMKKRRTQFLKNAGAALGYGQVYDGPIDRHVIKVATACRDTWTEMVRKLREERGGPA